MENLSNIHQMYSQKENILIRVKALKKIVQNLRENDEDKKALNSMIIDLERDYKKIISHLTIYGLEQFDQKEYFNHFQGISAQIERLKDIPEILSWVHNGFFDLELDGISPWMLEIESIDLKITGAWSGIFKSEKEGI